MYQTDLGLVGFCPLKLNNMYEGLNNINQKGEGAWGLLRVGEGAKPHHFFIGKQGKTNSKILRGRNVFLFIISGTELAHPLNFSSRHPWLEAGGGGG